MSIKVNKSEISSIPFIDCNISDFEVRPQEYQKEMFRNLSCLDFTSKTLNLFKKFGVPSVRSIELSFFICKNSTTIDNCFSYKDQDYYLSRYDYRFIYYFPGYNFKPRVLGKGAFEYFLDFFYTNVLAYPYFYPTTHYLNIQKVKLYTDVGILYDELESQESQRVKSNYYSVGGSPYEQDPIDKILKRKINQLIINVDTTTKIITRSYPKIYEVITKVIGVSIVVGYCIQIFLQKIYDSTTQELILHQLFDITEDTVNDIDNENVDFSNSKNYENIYNKNSSKEISLENLKKVSTHDQNLKILEGKSELEKMEEELKNKEISKQKSNDKEKLNDKEKVIDKINDKENMKRNSLVSFSDFNSKLKMKKISNDINLDNSGVRLNEIDKNEAKKYGADFQIIPAMKIPTAVKFIMKSYEVEKEGGGPTFSNYGVSTYDKCLLSFCDHLTLTFCCACGKAAKIKQYYDKVNEIVYSYSDILNITNLMFEFEKLKYLLLDEDQAAVFNYRSKIEVSKNSKKGSKFSSFYYFLKDLNDSVDLNIIKKELLERDNQKRFNERLINLS